MMEKRKQELLPGPIDTGKEYLTESQKKWLQVASDYEHGQTDFKTRHFVGDAQITPYQKFKQFLLELRSREESIENFVIKLEEKEAEIEYEHEKAERSDSPAFKKICKARAKDLDRERLITLRRMSLAVYERDQYLRMIQEMYDSKEAYLEDGTDLLDAIQDTYIASQLERDHWISRLGKQAALDLFSYGSITSGNLDAITQMDDEAAIQSLNIALSFSNKLKTELAIREQNIIENLDKTPLTTLDIHRIRKSQTKELE